jgi:hypothetical protein
MAYPDASPHRGDRSGQAGSQRPAPSGTDEVRSRADPDHRCIRPRPISAWGLWLTRRKKPRLATSRVFLRVAVWGAVLPFGMNTAGWFLTESGRQPWIVQGIMLTR